MRLRLVLNTSTHMEFVLKTWFLKPGLFALRIQASPGRKSPWRIQSANPVRESTRIQSANANPVRESTRIQSTNPRESSPRIQSANPVANPRESSPQSSPRIHANPVANPRESLTSAALRKVAELYEKSVLKTSCG